MKILFVINNFFVTGNGLAASARRTVQALRDAGHEVRILSGCKPTDQPQPDYPLKEFVFPIFQPLISSQGFSFASSTFAQVEEAVRWADVVHLEEVFVLQWKAIKAAKKLGKPVTGTYHLHPENIFSTLGMGKWKGINRLMLKAWRKYIFNDCLIVQCPTENVQDRLRRYHFKAELRVISNGLDLPAEPVVAEPKQPGDPVEILCIGRLASEKSQDTLLQAMRYSRYADRIHLQFAGNGPKARYYQKMAARLLDEGVLRVPASFGFFSAEELRALARKSYLYIHCAWVEVEGLSCLEATREGIVPVIGEGDLIGTSVFALCPESLYPACDSRALAERIDWWIEHPEERNRMAQRYADAARAYDIKDSIDALVRMFQDAIDAAK
jgi:glycosyltransferase involved in cell wall biosynthesis